MKPTGASLVILSVACIGGLERLAQGRRRTELQEKAQKLLAALPCEPIPPGAGDGSSHQSISDAVFVWMVLPVF
jgi:hypothetical protein